MKFFSVALRASLIVAVCMILCAPISAMHGLRRVAGFASRAVSSITKTREAVVKKRDCCGGGCPACPWSAGLVKSSAHLAPVLVKERHFLPVLFSEKDEWSSIFSTWSVGTPHWKSELSWKFYTLLEQEMRKTWKSHSIAWEHKNSFSQLTSDKVNAAFVYLDEDASLMCLQKTLPDYSVVFCLSEDCSRARELFAGISGEKFFVSIDFSGKYCCWSGDDCCRVFEGPREAMEYLAQEVKKDISYRDLYAGLDRLTRASLEMACKN